MKALPIHRSTVDAPTAAVAPPRSGTRIAVLAILAYAAHFPLALLEGRQPLVATIHALLSLAVGLAWALSGRRVWRVAYAAAYIAGAEVLWRMVGAHIFWEFGKYTVALCCLVA